MDLEARVLRCSLIIAPFYIILYLGHYDMCLGKVETLKLLKHFGRGETFHEISYQNRFAVVDLGSFLGISLMI